MKHLKKIFSFEEGQNPGLPHKYTTAHRIPFKNKYLRNTPIWQQIEPQNY